MVPAIGARAEGTCTVEEDPALDREPDAQVLDLNEVVGDFAPVLRRSLGEDCTLALRPDLTIGTVRADRGQIEQVLLNLAINARDAMPDGGALTFATENCVVAAERPAPDQEYTMKPGDYVLLRVRDTGVGMDDDTQRKIFEPFFTTKEIGKGTGLGLATAYGIVKQSGGYIKVRTAPGKGAEFPRLNDDPASRARPLEVGRGSAGRPARGGCRAPRPRASIPSLENALRFSRDGR